MEDRGPFGVTKGTTMGAPTLLCKNTDPARDEIKFGGGWIRSIELENAAIGATDVQ